MNAILGMGGEELHRVVRRQRPQDPRVVDEASDAGAREGEEPDHHHGTEEPADHVGAEALDREQAAAAR